MTESELIDLILENHVLTVGQEFQLKSGEMTDHFYNFGKLNSAQSLAQLATHMIGNIYGDTYTVLFTSAYKGIMITSAMLSECGLDFPNITFRMGYLRKEEKDHGEEGIVVGHCPGPGEVVVLVDDVFTTGQSLQEMADFIKSTGAMIESAIVVVRRGSLEVKADVEQLLDCPIRCLVSDDKVMAKYKMRNTR
jgi:orotate phosphoribosyltransferase